jgi:hypothetical protein
LPIKEIRIVFLNSNAFAVNATLYVYAATGGAGTGVDNRASLHSHHQQHPEWSVPTQLWHTQYRRWIPEPVDRAIGKCSECGHGAVPHPYPAVGTSADVFAWDQNGNGVIDTGEYFFFGGTPRRELRD